MRFTQAEDHLKLELVKLELRMADALRLLGQRLSELETRHLGRGKGDIMNTGKLRPVTSHAVIGPGLAPGPYTGSMLTTRDRIQQPIYRGGILFDGEYGNDERMAVGKQVGYRPEAKWRVSRPLEQQRRSSGFNQHQLARNDRFATERVCLLPPATHAPAHPILRSGTCHRVGCAGAFTAPAGDGDD